MAAIQWDQSFAVQLADKRLGLLINYNEELLVNGITRISNGLV